MRRVALAAMLLSSAINPVYAQTVRLNTLTTERSRAHTDSVFSIISPEPS